HILALHKVLVPEGQTESNDATVALHDITFDDSIVQVQYFYDHILCLRKWLESLYDNFYKVRFGQDSFTNFEIEINEGKAALVICKDEKENANKAKETHNNFIWGPGSDDDDDDDDDNDFVSDSVVDMYTWDNVQVGDEFAHICQEGQSAMSNATQYIVLGEYVELTNEEKEHTQRTNEKESNNKASNGWNIIDLLKADDEVEKNQLCEVFSKGCLLWKEKIVIYLFYFFFFQLKRNKIKHAKRQLDLFIAMLNKAHKSIRELTITHAFDQMTIFPVLPNLIHLHLKDISISSCFESIDMKELMPQLKTLNVKNLSMTSCMYCNWKQRIEEAETCNSNDNDSLMTSVPPLSPRLQQNQNCSGIKFLNHLLLSCPNLLALYYYGTDENSDILEIPSTLEWLLIYSMPWWGGPLPIQLDLSRCKRINGLSWTPSFVKWPTETMLKIGWLKIERQEDIKYWDDLLSLPTKPCDVKLCALRSTMNIYDLTSDNSIFPHQSRFTSKQTIAKKPGINYRDAERFLQYNTIDAVDFNNTKKLGKKLIEYEDEPYFEKGNVIIERPILFFQNIVKAMGTDNNKVDEYQRWFDIGEASWIFNLLCPKVCKA
ncbi:hypothetical protein RFI_28737, partial [Reticulomyxa filosa]